MTHPAPLSATAARARALAGRISELGQEAETLRQLPHGLVELMVGEGFFDILLPKALGGLELDMLDALAVIEEVSAADPAAGWSLLKGSTTNQIAGYLDPAAARQIWNASGIVAAGSMNPGRGRAVPAPGGYRLTGRWDWGTATRFSQWLMGGALITDGQGPPKGMRVLFFPADKARFIDTWDVYGMRGTGSGDFEVEDLFVPEDQTFEPGALLARTDAPLYAKVPYMAQIMAPHGALAVGVARAALDALIELARERTPLASKSLLKDKYHVQDAVGRASAEIDASRAYIHQSVREAWSAPEFTPALALQLSLAATHATHRCVAAVDLLTQAAGGAAVYSASPLQRRFRDIHVAASHFLVNIEKYAGAGKTVFGDAPSPLAG